MGGGLFLVEEVLLLNVAVNVVEQVVGRFPAGLLISRNERSVVQVGQELDVVFVAHNHSCRSA
jgi:hypothetical protein